MAEEITKQSDKQNCKECKKEFLIIQQEQNFYKKKGLPYPSSCPDCRRKRRLSMRNEKVLYKRKCDKCSKEIISTYRPESPYVVYCQECFWQHIG